MESNMEELSEEKLEDVKEKFIVSLKDLEKKTIKLYGIPTGVEGLDDLFFTTRIVNGKPHKESLKGYPAYSVINLTGISDTGKSLMVEQFTVKQASLGNSVLFITVESPAPFIALSLRERAKAMGINYENIEDKIFIIDASTNSELRESFLTLQKTIISAIKDYNIKCTVIDSITGFFEEKEMLARGVVRRFFNLMKKWHQTAIFVSQKRSGHEELSAEAAGGYAVSHIVDCSIVLTKYVITKKYEESIFKKPIGEIVRLFRIDGCRLCGHDTSTRIMEISETGLVKIGPPLSKLSSGSKVEVTEE
ncbi:MAG: KaiC domain-containing protein [Dictyoglomus sp. NZ13-RE01]|nr:MAG: KaiC domain-containing protein [Dictyoglomus sp. NZ13-RE01]